MTRFFALSIFCVVAGGVALHQGAELPLLGDWVGALPGDLIIRRKGVTLYLPFTSAVLVSGALSLIFSLLSGRSDK